MENPGDGNPGHPYDPGVPGDGNHGDPEDPGVLVIQEILGMEVLRVVHAMTQAEHAHSTSCHPNLERGNLDVPGSKSGWHEVEWACFSPGMVCTTLSIEERLTS